MTRETVDDEIAEVKAESLDDHIVVTLTKPIRVFNDRLTELRMKMPTAGDMMRVGGVPVVLYEDHCEHSPVFMSRMIAKLVKYKEGYGIPVGSVERMDARDWMAAAWALNSFFLPTAQQKTPPPD